MAGLGELLGPGSTAGQFLIWNVLSQLLAPLMQPLMNELSADVLSQFPNTPMDAGQVAQLLARHLIDQGDAQDLADDTGVRAEYLAHMVKLAQAAPDMSLAGEALRRGLVPEGTADPESVSFRGMLTDAGIKAEWHDVLVKLTRQVPSVAEVMNAWLEGQIDEAEARKRYLAAGGDPTWFQTSYDANGQAPTPVQALEMLNRRLIPAEGTGPQSISYHQAFLEGPWRNKWLAPFLGLREYLPPPRTVTAMYKEHSIDQATAADLLSKQGLSAEAVGWYLAAGQNTKHPQEKHLAKSEVLAMYTAHLLKRDEAKGGLTKLGYAAHDADELLALADVRMVASQTTAAVTRVRGLFLAGKLTKAAAQATLAELGVDHAKVADVLAVWDLEASKAVKTLTAAQVETAWYYQLISESDAIGRLVTLGYDRDDAWVLLALRNKGPLKGRTAGQPGGPVHAVTTAGGKP